jgi:heterodisulfide reductase subunit B
MKSYLYYPGCSMEGSGRSYAESLSAILAPLDIALSEIDDWNCCGATEFVSLSTTPAYAMIARNLAIAARARANTGALTPSPAPPGAITPSVASPRALTSPASPRTLVAACSACYLNLAKTDRFMKAQPALAGRVNDALSAGGLHYDPGTIRVRHLLDVIINDVGTDAVRAAVRKPLTGLRVAPYLGCMVPRPDPSDAYADHEQPRDLDRLLAALGAEVVDYPLRTECCGGHMTQIAPAVGLELIRRLVSEAENRKAVLMATVCPMCQINIDAYQGEMNAAFDTHHHMPIVFFTQLMGLAFGLEPADLGVGREYTEAKSLLVAALENAPAAAAAAEAARAAAPRPRPEARALPMPRMPAQGSDNAAGAQL